MTDFRKKSLNAQVTHLLILKANVFYKDKYTQIDKYLWPFKNEWEPRRYRTGKNTHITKIQHLKLNFITRNSFHVNLYFTQHLQWSAIKGSFVIRAL